VNKITTIIFDYGGVLGSEAPIYFDNFYTDFSDLLLFLELPVEQAKTIWKQHWFDLKTDKISLDDFWHILKKETGKDFDIPDLKKKYFAKFKVDYKAFDIVQKLKKNRYKLFILANESREGMGHKVMKFDLDQMFAKVYCSAYHKIAKPDIALYRYVATDLEVPAEQILFIDNSEKNLEPAKIIGWQTILFTKTDKLVKELNELGIQIN